jgi:hypothetical protein
MKSYNIPNYIRYKEDLKQVNKDNSSDTFQYYLRNDLIARFLPLVENIAKKFSTSTEACGILKRYYRSYSIWFNWPCASS